MQVLRSVLNHVNITTLLLRVICHPFGKTGYSLSIYTRGSAMAEGLRNVLVSIELESRAYRVALFT